MRSLVGNTGAPNTEFDVPMPGVTQGYEKIPSGNARAYKLRIHIRDWMGTVTCTTVPWEFIHRLQSGKVVVYVWDNKGSVSQAGAVRVGVS